MTDKQLMADSADAPADQWSRPRPAGDAPTERACMSCGTTFLSEGWHNRLCQQCRKRSEPDA